MTLNFVVSFNLQLKSSGISNSKVLVVYFTLHAVGMLHAPEGLHHLPKDIKPHPLASHLELDPENNLGVERFSSATRKIRGGGVRHAGCDRHSEVNRQYW